MTSQHNSPPLLSWRLATGLFVLALIQTVLVCCLLAPPDWGWPLAGYIPTMLLPQTLVVTAISLALLSPPVLFAETAAYERGLFHTQALFAGIWQAALAGFLLLVCSRLTQLDNAPIAHACAWIALASLLSTALHRLLPRAANGVLFVGVVAVPVLSYFLAELFLSSAAGSAGWQRASGAQADALRVFVHWALNLSPVTAAVGALRGTLADGSPYGGWPPLLLFTALTGALIARTPHRNLEQH